MAEKTVKLGFVGAGGRTVRELLDLVQVPGVEIAALADIDEARCQQAIERVQSRTAQGGDAEAMERAGNLNPKTYGDVMRLLDGSDVDAVYVSLPPFAHGEIEHAILDAGKALFVEKPVAIDMETARKIQDHARQAEVITCVGYQSRYSTAVQAAKKLLHDVPIGMAIAMRFGGLPGTAWWKVQNRSGGMLVEQHTHGVDLMRYLVGEVESVFAFGNTKLLTDVQGLDIFDVNSVALKFANGAVGSIANTCALQAGQGSPQNINGAVHIVAKNMTVQAGAGGVTVFKPERQREEIAAEGDPNLEMNRAFVKAVRTGDRKGILSSYDDGLKTFELTYACQHSAERGEPITLGQGY
ncbi:MAG TPA: Gfo/Idh/MocA family oxidoreductase [Chloroflexota bacterium]|nr:Gfo/Idh/MocA family oxidoreductase [Chloroflexota bacterium]